jgi:hypothetical protein
MDHVNPTRSVAPKPKGFVPLGPMAETAGPPFLTTPCPCVGPNLFSVRLGPNPGQKAPPYAPIEYEIELERINGRPTTQGRRQRGLRLTS